MRLGVLFMLAVVTLPAASKKPVTIDDVLAERDDGVITPVWSPDGQSFAYVKEKRVYRVSLSSGDAKTKVSKAALWFDLGGLDTQPSGTANAEPYQWRNRRVATEMLQWLPNSEDVLVASEGKLYIVKAAGKMEAIPLAQAAEDAQLSPDGKQILYRFQNDLYAVPVAAGKPVRLTTGATDTLWNGRLDWVYPEELDLGQAAWWSPDSKQVAFLQFDVSQEVVYPHADLLGVRALAEPQRYPQAGTPNARVRLGIVSASGGPTQWEEPGNNPDTLMARVAWLPDSSAVALETMPRIQNALDLWFCNPTSGTAKPIIHEQSKTFINVADNLYFLKKNAEFLWTSERSGYRHIYRYSDDGKLLGQVTSGAWEVKAIERVKEDVAEDQRRILYTSTEESPLETHLYGVGLTGGARTRITQPGFNHGLSVDPTGRWFVDRASNLTSPGETVLRDASGNQLSVLHVRDEKLAAHYDLPQTVILHLEGPDGSTLYGRLTKPIGFRAGQKYPLIVAVYGGPGAQSVRNQWPSVGMDQVYAARGYLVWRLDNRGSTGRGHAFEEPLYRKLGDVEVADQRAGVAYLVKLGLADPERVGITGWSYGGYMTIRCLLQAPDVFKVGVAGAPVTDWHNYDTIYTERYLGLPQDNADAYAAASNVVNAGNLRGKLFLQMNVEDDNVLFQNTLQMVNAFEYANKQYTMQLYPFKTHGVSGPLRKPLYEGMLEFFNRNLR